MGEKGNGGGVAREEEEEEKEKGRQEEVAEGRELSVSTTSTLNVQQGDDGSTNKETHLRRFFRLRGIPKPDPDLARPAKPVERGD